MAGSIAGCLAKAAAGLGVDALVDYGVDQVVGRLLNGVMAGLEELFAEEPPPPKPPALAVTVGHQIKHASLLAAIAGAAVGALISFAAGAVAVAVIGATGGAALVVGVAAAMVVGPLVAKASSAVTDFIDGCMPADDGPVATGSPNVFIEGKPAARAGDDKVACKKHGTPKKIAQGSETVYINGKPAVRVDDKTECGAPIKESVKTVWIGIGQQAVCEIGDEFSFWEKALIMGVEYLIPPSKGMVNAIKNTPKILAKTLPKMAKAAAKGAQRAFRSSSGNMFSKGLKAAARGVKGATKTALAGACKSKKPSKKPSESKNKKNQEQPIACTIPRPVDLITGAVFKDFTDIILGQTISLKFQRVYRSNNQNSGLLGQGWWDSFSDHLTIDKARSIVELDRGNGLIITFDFPRDTVEVFNRRHPHLTLTAYTHGYILHDTETELFYYYKITSNTKAQLVKVADRNDNAILYHYNNYILTHITHTDGVVLKLQYHPTGFLHQIWRTDTQSHQLLAEYQQQDGLLIHAWAEGDIEHHMRYEKRRMTMMSYNPRDIVYYQYNEKGYCTHQESKDGSIYWDLTYDLKQRINYARNKAGSIWQYHYNEDNQVTQEILPNGAIYGFEYDNYGLITARYYPLDRSVNYHYDEWSGRLVEVIDSLKRSTKLYYDNDFTHIEKLEDDSGITRFIYDDREQVVAMELPCGRRVDYAYDQRGNLTEIIRNGEYRQRFGYDAHSRLTQLEDALGQTQQFSYTQDDLISQVMSARGHQWQYQYDKAWRLQVVQSPLNSTTHLHYTLDNDVSEIQDARGERQKTTYGAFGVLTSQTDAKGQTTHFKYDPIHQQLSTVINVQGGQWQFYYDDIGQLIKETDYHGYTTHYHYDLAGRLVEKHTPAGHVHTFTYDKADRLTNKITPEGKTTYQWDNQDRLVTLNSPHSRLYYHYDLAGRVTKEEQNQFIIRYEYDDEGRRVARHIQESSQTPNPLPTHTYHYRYDALDRLIYLALRGESEALTFTWDADDNLVRSESQAGFTQVCEYDAHQRLTQQTVGRDARLGFETTLPKLSHLPQLTLVDRSYHYDATDNLTQEKQSTTQQQWHYDANEQITQYVRQSGIDSRSTTYHYNSLGRQQQQFESGASTSTFTTRDNTQRFHYQHSGQLTQQTTSQGKIDYEYDSGGRLALKTETKHGFRPQIQRYQWDSDNQLIGVITPQGHQWHYGYDGLGRRIKRWCDQTGEQIDSIWDGHVLAQERHSFRSDLPTPTTPEVIVYDWQFLPDSFHPLTQQVHYYRYFDSDQTWQNHPLKPVETYYLVTDHMGTVRELFTPQGDQVAKQRLDLWGKPQWCWDKPFDTDLLLAAIAPTCPMGFQGQYYDSPTGLHYNYYRYYDAQMGQYLTLDPIGLLGGLDPYAYVYNPMGWIDPWGLANTYSTYVLKDANGKIVYVGITERNPMDRLREHANGSVTTPKKDFATMEVLKQNMTRRQARNIEGSLLHQKIGENLLNKRRLDGGFYHSYSPKPGKGRRYINETEMKKLLDKPVVTHPNKGC